MMRARVTYSIGQGAAITGTLQIMSRRLLQALEEGRKSTKPSIELEDNLESSGLVIAYAIYRRLVEAKVGTPQEQRELHQAFFNNLGGTCISQIRFDRLTARPTVTVEFNKLTRRHKRILYATCTINTPISSSAAEAPSSSMSRSLKITKIPLYADSLPQHLPMPA
ncbi:hypothetical protein BV20DRAFT_1084255 [Pilatotrama ljubarskyi]|nr:hypothetical protein BV20DRAFT_1084255 [Pilatotrama ljubarskyi]